METDSKYLHGDLTGKIIGACFEVYREKGCGFAENVYQECLEIEFRLQGIPFAAQRPVPLDYKGSPLRAIYQPDFICFDTIILEIKAITDVADEHRAQVLNYLKVAKLELGLLVNLGHYPKTEVERIIANSGRFSSNK